MSYHRPHAHCFNSLERIARMSISVPGPGIQPLKRSGRLFLVVLVLGLLLRLVFLYATQSTGLMIVDERHYHQLARNVLHGYGFGWTPETPTSILSLRPSSGRSPVQKACSTCVWHRSG